MARVWVLFACITCAGFLPPHPLRAQNEPKQAPAPEVEEPPEEDADARPKEYAFNPLQATKELRVGDFYFKRGNFKGAIARYREAAKWNPTYADAYLRIGEAFDKLKEKDQAKEAYAKFLELAPTDKRAADIRKRMK